MRTAAHIIFELKAAAEVALDERAHDLQAEAPVRALRKVLRQADAIVVEIKVPFLRLSGRWCLTCAPRRHAPSR